MQEISTEYERIIDTFILSARNTQKRFPDMLIETRRMWQKTESFYEKYTLFPYLYGCLDTGFELLEDSITKNQKSYLDGQKLKLDTMKKNFYYHFIRVRECGRNYYKWFGWFADLPYLPRKEINQSLDNTYINNDNKHLKNLYFKYRKRIDNGKNKVTS
ncbi:hypothetical protein JXI42_08390 [bacterium]|nr:hypothetical protein [bacterium]